MKKLIVGLALVSTLATSYAHGRNDIATGIIGGIVAGAALQHYYHPHQPYYHRPPVVIYPPTYYPNPCYWVQEPILDAWGNVMAYRNVKVCRTY